MHGAAKQAQQHTAGVTASDQPQQRTHLSCLKNAGAACLPQRRFPWCRCCLERGLPSPRRASTGGHDAGGAGADKRGSSPALRSLLRLMQVEVRDYRPFDDPQPENPSSVVLSAVQLRQADPSLSQAAQLLAKDLKVRPGREWAAVWSSGSSGGHRCS